MARVYVGNLPMDMSRADVEGLFSNFKPVDVDLKIPNRPPAFAFITFDSPRDAEEAVRGMDGHELLGGDSRLRVELARGGRDRDRGFPAGEPRGRGSNQSEYRVIVTGLPPSASWQDLKDHMRRAGDVMYTDVDHRGGGIVHYSNPGDMEYALRKLDDTEFRNPFDSTYIRVLPPRGGPPPRYRSRSRSGDRQRRRSPVRSRSPSRSRSRDRGGRRERDDRAQAADEQPR